MSSRNTFAPALVLNNEVNFDVYISVINSESWKRDLIPCHMFILNHYFDNAEGFITYAIEKIYEDEADEPNFETVDAAETVDSTEIVEVIETVETNLTEVSMEEKVDMTDVKRVKELEYDALLKVINVNICDYDDELILIEFNSININRVFDRFIKALYGNAIKGKTFTNDEIEVLLPLCRLLKFNRFIELYEDNVSLMERFIYFSDLANISLILPAAIRHWPYHLRYFISLARKDLRVIDIFVDYMTLDMLNKTKFGRNFPIGSAANFGLIDYLKKFIDAGFNLEAVDKKGNTALIHSCMGLWPECTSMLAQAGANINNCNIRGDTALLCAIYQTSTHPEEILEDHNLSCVNVLLDAGADIDYINRNTKLSALIYAIRRGKYRTAMLLINRGANMNYKSMDESVWIGYKGNVIDISSEEDSNPITAISELLYQFKLWISKGQDLGKYTPLRLLKGLLSYVVNNPDVYLSPFNYKLLINFVTDSYLTDSSIPDLIRKKIELHLFLAKKISYLLHEYATIDDLDEDSFLNEFDD